MRVTSEINWLTGDPSELPSPLLHINWIEGYEDEVFRGPYSGASCPLSLRNTFITKLQNCIKKMGEFAHKIQ